jgi:N12 class adenine-specific DNA methylase
MVLGRQTSESTQYGRQDFTVVPLEGADLADQLHEARQNIHGTYQEVELPDLGEGETIDDTLPADPNVKNYSYTVVDGEVYFRENSIMVRPDLNATATARIKGMVELRDRVHDLIDLQMADASDAAIHEKQAELNRLYDDYTAKYGLINDRANRLAFSDDSSYYLLCSLEILDEDHKLAHKADMFTKRTIQQHRPVTSVETASEALAVSIAEKAGVDMAYMSQLSGKTEQELADDLRGVIFRVPEQEPAVYQAADEYLSGNVRQKLREATAAAEFDPAFSINVEALTAAQPKDLDASEIEVRLGATWIDKQYIQQFMVETFQTPWYLRRVMQVQYSPHTAEWQISNKTKIPYDNVAAHTTYGTDRASAYRILEDSLNLRDIRIYDTVEDADGKERRVLNQRETTLAAQKQQAIRDAFRDWLWRDPERRETLVRQYNEEMNSTRPRQYDGSHINFVGMNPEITLRQHQRDAIAHVLYGGNTLLAHTVGAGKTFEMVASAMEAKRLGLCQKSIFVVPNHLTEQWASDFLQLYPSANILVTAKKDFEPANRKKFCARIATGDYDAVIIGHSQFEKIPISQARQERLLREQIEVITDGIAEVKASNGERFTVKQLERSKKQLEARLEKLQANDRKDDVITFEQLGVDRMFVDEAHSYKNLFTVTKMRNVAGITTTDAQKSSDMFAKCRYLDEITGGRGVVFATGTPISNSMTELYTMQRYLQYDRLQEMGMAHFDCWASRFGETTTALELAPEGTGYRARTRFARFFNLPELMNLFKEVADIKTADQLHLPVPEADYQTVVAKPTAQQKELVKSLSERAAEIHSGNVDPSIDNMLKVTTDGRKLGLDQRLINPLLPDEPGTKVNQCVENIVQIWRDGEADKLTQLVFCDVSTPKSDGGFNVYDDIRGKLVAQGIPEEQIAFIHDANTEQKKADLFSKVRSGQVRVLLGSTQKMGAGTNCQDRLVALHDLDCPWRPGDLEQRAGRIIRQGNRNEKVHIYRYVTENTFDSYLYQTVETKQKFIGQIMTSKSPVRSCEDADETALSYAEIKALCAGDPRIKERMDLDVEVSRLKLMKADHQSKRFQLEHQLLHHFPQQIEQAKELITAIQADIQQVAEHPHPKDGFAGLDALGHHWSEKENAGGALLEACKTVKGAAPVDVGNYRSFGLSVSFDSFNKVYTATLQGHRCYNVTLGSDARGNLTRLDNALDSLPRKQEAAEAQLENLYQQQAAAKEEAVKPFPQEEALREKSARLILLDAELNMDAPQREQPAEKKPSIRAALQQPVPPPTFAERGADLAL